MLDVLFALLRVMVMSTCRHVPPMERADRVAQTAGVVRRLCEKEKKGRFPSEVKSFTVCLLDSSFAT